MWLPLIASALADVVALDPIPDDPPRQWQSWLIGAVGLALVVGAAVYWKKRG